MSRRFRKRTLDDLVDDFSAMSLQPSKRMYTETYEEVDVCTSFSYIVDLPITPSQSDVYTDNLAYVVFKVGYTDNLLNNEALAALNETLVEASYEVNESSYLDKNEDCFTHLSFISTQNKAYVFNHDSKVSTILQLGDKIIGNSICLQIDINHYSDFLQALRKCDYCSISELNNINTITYPNFTVYIFQHRTEAK